MLQHDSFQKWLEHKLQELVSPCTPETLAPWKGVLTLAWAIDLTPWLPELVALYASCGRPARDPLSMLRSCLLMVCLGEPSIDDFAARLSREPILCLACGFDVGDIPGAATFRDFYRRLYGQPVRQARVAHRSRREKLNLKPGEEAPPRHPGIIKKVADAALSVMGLDSSHLVDVHDKLLATAALKSADMGLLGDPKSIKAAADGSPLRTGAHSYGRKTCSCEGRCRCERRFCDPDARHGWDSREHHYYFGYSIYMLGAAGTEHNLPLALDLHGATRHDATALPRALVKFHRLHQGKLTISEVIADAAHDQIPIYTFLNACTVTPVIDPKAPESLRKDQPLAHSHGVTPNAKGRPVCQAGRAMASRGRAAKGRPRFTCPLGKDATCEHPCPFRDHLFVVNDRNNPRLNGDVPFGSKAFEKEYAMRTVDERIFAAIKVHLGVQHARHRRRYLWLGHLTLAAIALHVKAWLRHLDLALPAFFPR